MCDGADAGPVVFHGDVVVARRVLGTVDAALDLADAGVLVKEEEVQAEPLRAEVEAMAEPLPLLVEHLARGVHVVRGRQVRDGTSTSTTAAAAAAVGRRLPAGGRVDGGGGGRTVGRRGIVRRDGPVVLVDVRVAAAGGWEDGRVRVCRRRWR